MGPMSSTAPVPLFNCLCIRQTANPNFGDYTADDLYRNYSTPTDPANSQARGTVFYDYTSSGHIDHVTTNVGQDQTIHPSETTGKDDCFSVATEYFCSAFDAGLKQSL